MSPAERQRLRAIPARIPGEAVSEQGIPALESDFQLSRSPGCFVVTLSSDGSEVYIGEDWVGLGTSEDEGGLEGCSEDRPGLVFLADGRMFPVGGKTTKSASSIYTEAGAAGTTLLLALIPDPDSGLTGIVYRAIHVSGTISGNLGVWDDARDYLPPTTYDDYHIVPIAAMDLIYAGGVAKIRDVYWNLDKPAVSLGGIGTEIATVQLTGLHPFSPAAGVRMYTGDVYGNGSTSAATASNVAIRIPGIAPNVTVPAFGAWNTVPKCGAIGYRGTTWIGSAGLRTETVYETFGLLVLG